MFRTIYKLETKNIQRPVRRLLVGVICSGLTACTGEIRQSRPHDPSPAPVTEPRKAHTDSETLETSQLNSMSLTELASSITNDLPEIKRFSTQSFRQRTERLHTLLLEKDNEPGVTGYLNSVLQECDENKLDDCTNVQILKNTPRFTDILVRGATLESHVPRSLFFLRLYFDIAPHLINPQAVLLFAENVAKIVESDAALAPPVARQLVQIVSIQMATLTEVHSRNFSERIDRLKNQWTHLHLSQPVKVNVNRVTISQWGLRKVTSQDIFAELEKTFEKDLNFDESFGQALARVIKHANSVNLDRDRWGINTFTREGLAKNAVFAAAFIKVHEIFHGRDLELNSDALRDIPSNTVARLMRWYMQIYLIDETLKTAEVLGEIFLDFKAQGHGRSAFLVRVMAQVQGHISPRWARFFEGVRNLERAFIDYVEVQSGPMVAESEKTRTYFVELPQAVSYYAGMPAMITLAYYGAKYDYSEKVDLGFTSFELNAKMLNSILLDGDFNPIFNFSFQTKVERVANEAQTLISLAAVSELDLIRLFQIDANDLIQQISRSALSADLTKVQEAYVKYQRQLEPDAPIGRLLRACRNLNANQPVEIPGSLRHMMGNTTFGNAGYPTVLDPLKATVEIWANDDKTGTIQEAIEILRSDISWRLDKIRILEDLLLKQTSASTAWAVDLRKKYVDVVQKTGPEVANCLVDLSHIEFELRFYTWQKEKELLQEIDLAAIEIKQLRQTNPEAVNQRLQQFNLEIAQKTGIAQYGAVNRGFLEDYLNKGGLRFGNDDELAFRYRDSEFGIRNLHYVRQHPKYGRQFRWNIPLPATMREYLREVTAANDSEKIPKTRLLMTGDLPDSAREVLLGWTSWFDVKTGPALRLREMIHTLTSIERFAQELQITVSKDVKKLAESNHDRLEFLINFSRDVIEYARMLPYEKKYLVEDARRDYIFFTRGFLYPFTFGTLPLRWGGIGDEVMAALTSEYLGVSAEFKGYRGSDTNMALRASGTPDGGGAMGGQREMTEKELISRKGLVNRAKKNYVALKSFKDRLLVPLSQAQQDSIDRLLIAPIASRDAMIDQFLKQLDEKRAQGWDTGPIELYINDVVLTDPWVVGFRSQLMYDRKSFHNDTMNFYLVD